MSRTPISVVSGTGTQIADTSCSSTSLTVPGHPPPLIHYTPRSPSQVSEPFVLCFVTGNISVCHGCRQKYPKPQMTYVCDTKNGVNFSLLVQGQLRLGSATSTITATRLAFKPGTQHSCLNCFRYQQHSFCQCTLSI